MKQGFSHFFNLKILIIFYHALTKVHSGLLVSRQFFSSGIFNHWTLAKYHKTHYFGIGGNNMATFIYYQILANTLIILKLRMNENIIAILPINILLTVMVSYTFVSDPDPYTSLNSTCA